MTPLMAAALMAAGLTSLMSACESFRGADDGDQPAEDGAVSAEDGGSTPLADGDVASDGWAPPGWCPDGALCESFDHADGAAGFTLPWSKIDNSSYDTITLDVGARYGTKGTGGASLRMIPHTDDRVRMTSATLATSDSALSDFVLKARVLVQTKFDGVLDTSDGQYNAQSLGVEHSDVKLALAFHDGSVSLMEIWSDGSKWNSSPGVDILDGNFHDIVVVGTLAGSPRLTMLVDGVERETLALQSGSAAAGARAVNLALYARSPAVTGTVRFDDIVYHARVP